MTAESTNHLPDKEEERDTRPEVNIEIAVSENVAKFVDVDNPLHSNRLSTVATGLIANTFRGNLHDNSAYILVDIEDGEEGVTLHLTGVNRSSAEIERIQGEQQGADGTNPPEANSEPDSSATSIDALGLSPAEFDYSHLDGDINLEELSEFLGTDDSQGIDFSRANLNSTDPAQITDALSATKDLPPVEEIVSIHIAFPVEVITEEDPQPVVSFCVRQCLDHIEYIFDNKLTSENPYVPMFAAASLAHVLSEAQQEKVQQPFNDVMAALANVTNGRTDDEDHWVKVAEFIGKAARLRIAVG